MVVAAKCGRHSCAAGCKEHRNADSAILQVRLVVKPSTSTGHRWTLNAILLDNVLDDYFASVYNTNKRLRFSCLDNEATGRQGPNVDASPALSTNYPSALMFCTFTANSSGYQIIPYLYATI